MFAQSWRLGLVIVQKILFQSESEARSLIENRMKHLIYIGFIVFLLSCQREEITLDTKADDTFYIQNSGASQRVQVRGNTLSGKIILTIHGGPGGSSYYLSYLDGMKDIESDFAVAYLDQQIAGGSQGNNVGHTIDDFAEGVKKTISVLRHRYGNNQKIILYSESWGGVVTAAFLTKENNQQMVDGWINSDAPHDFHLQDRLMCPMAVTIGNDQIATGNNVSKWNEIISYCNSHDPANNYSDAKELNELLGEAEYLIDTVVKVDFNTLDIFWSESQTNNAPFTALGFNLFSNEKNEIEKGAYKKNYEEAISIINIPLLILWGKYDFIAPPAVGDSLFNKVSSIEKEKVILQRSGHNGFLQEPKIYWTKFKEFMDKL